MLGLAFVFDMTESSGGAPTRTPEMIAARLSIPYLLLLGSMGTNLLKQGA
jgi:hypothetical protein